MEATRVPPSAWITSQSRMIERSPSTLRSITARNERPISRWISCVRPLGRPFATSRVVRVAVARGSIEYSAVTQPLPVLRRNAGTEDSTLAAQSTCVFPTVISAEPSAVFKYPVAISTGRNSSGFRPSGRIFHHLIEQEHSQEHPENQKYDARYTGFHLRRGVGLRPGSFIFTHSLTRLLSYGGDWETRNFQFTIRDYYAGCMQCKPCGTAGSSAVGIPRMETLVARSRGRTCRHSARRRARMLEGGLHRTRFSRGVDLRV